MFLIHTNQCPAHLGNIVTPLLNNPSRQRLRSSTGTDYLIPRTIGRSSANDRSRLLVRPPAILYHAETVRAVTDKTAIKHISSISKSCFLNICDLRRIRNTTDQTTAIATSLIHSKIDYCNSLQLNLPATQMNRLQLVLNSALLVLSTKLKNFITLLLFLNLSTGSR